MKENIFLKYEKQPKTYLGYCFISVGLSDNVIPLQQHSFTIRCKFSFS